MVCCGTGIYSREYDQNGPDNQETISEKYPPAETLVFAVEKKGENQNPDRRGAKHNAYNNG